MAKTILGVDVGYDSLKLALVNGGAVKKTVSVAMPRHLIKEGRIVSPETMGELIRTAMKENGIRCRRAAFALPNESVYIRSVVMPVMSVEQLLYNIPYEFSDYITDELKNYVFDYAMLSNDAYGETSSAARGESGADGTGAPESDYRQDAGTMESRLPERPELSDGERPGSKTMELMAVAAPRTLMEETAQMLRKADLKLVKAAPALCGYISMIRKKGVTDGKDAPEYCILDLGSQAIRMYMFRGDRHMVTRALEIGVSTLDGVIAEARGVDVHLAHTYLTTNYDDCQNQEYCLNAYGNIAVELLRALNFYKFSNPDSMLSDVWLCGGGALIEPLRRSIADTLDMQVHAANELLPPGLLSEEDGALFAQAIGIAVED